MLLDDLDFVFDVNGVQIRAKLPNEVIRDEVGDHATKSDARKFFLENERKITDAAIASARACAPTELEQLLPYVGWARRPFEHVQVIDVKLAS